MVAFTIHEMPEPPAERLDRADALVFVREGFSWTAAFFAPVWLFLGGMWIAFAAYVVIVALLIAIFSMIGGLDNYLYWALAGLHLMIGLEADSIIRWTLGRAGWRDLGAVTGKNQDECERNFYDAWLQSQPMITARSPTTPTLGKSVA